MTQHKGQIVGYVRVSTDGQNTVRQLDGMTLDRTFTDKASGKDTERPQLMACIAYVREGDVLAVHSMDRLARNLDDLRRLVLLLTKKGVRVKFIKESLEFSGDDSPMSNLLLSVMGAFAQFERDLIRERQKEGIAIAKRNGVYKGRKPSLSPEEAEMLRRRIALGERKTDLAREFGVSRGVIYSYGRTKN